MSKRTALFLSCFVLLTTLIVLPVSAQSTPPQLQVALDMLGSYLGRGLSLTDMDRYSYSQAFYSDTSYGCSLFTTPTSLASPTSAYTVELIFQSIRYEFRVREDLSDAFPCDAAMLAALNPGQAGVITPTPPPAETNCPPGYVGYLMPRLVVGGQARLGVGGTANRMRSLPSREADQIAFIDPGTTVLVLDGPSCEDASRIIWWRVDNNGTIGWTAEGLGDDYFLAPVAGGPLNLPTERVRITNSTLNSLVPLATLAYPDATSVSISNNGLVAIGGGEGLLLYDLNTLEQLALQLTIQPIVHQVAFSPDSRYLAFATDDDELYITDTQTNVTITPSPEPNLDIQTLAFSSTNLLGVGGGDAVANSGRPSSWIIYDIANQRQLAVRPTGSYVRDVAFSPDGSQFAWVDTMLNVINVSDGASLLSQAIVQPLYGGLTWRPNIPAGLTNEVAYADGTNVRLLSLGGSARSFGEAPAFFPGVVRFTPDGLYLAAMNLQFDGDPVPAVINIFDATTGQQLYGTGFEQGMDFAFSPDGTLLILVTTEQVIFLGVDTESTAVG